MSLSTPRLISWALRCIVVGGVGYWLYQNDDSDLLGIIFQSPGYIAAAWFLGVVAMGLAAIRWQLLMTAFGARTPPAVRHLWQLNLIGHFYNVFVPGSVGGDIARGFVARQAFNAPTTSYFVIAGERILGLATLGIVFGLGVLLGPRIPSIEDAAVWVAIPVFLGLIGFGVALMGRRIRHWWRSAPELKRPGLVGLAALLSIVTHGLTIAAFFILSIGCALGADGGGLPLTLIILIVPIALIAQVLPVAIAGIGPREVALVFLLPSVSTTTDSGAMALSLSYACANVCLALSGGLLQIMSGSRLLHPLEGSEDADEEHNTVP